MAVILIEVPKIVHCRTGSLEKHHLVSAQGLRVHCRTGSLEMLITNPMQTLTDHCRTGSLEIYH